LTELECPEFYIKCDDGLQCIKEENLCDFGIHCNDLSDENHEKCASKYIVLITNNYHCRVPDKEWSFQDGGLYIIKKVDVKILTIIILYRLS
jgi:hypothetical protein